MVYLSADVSAIHPSSDQLIVTLACGSRSKIHYQRSMHVWNFKSEVTWVRTDDYKKNLL